MTEQDIDIIESYIKNKLDKTTKLEFEKRMEMDADFKQEVEIHTLINASVIEKGLDDLKSKMKSKSPEEWTKNTDFNKQIYKWFLAASITTILTTIGLWTFSLKEKAISPIKEVTIQKQEVKPVTVPKNEHPKVNEIVPSNKNEILTKSISPSQTEKIAETLTINSKDSVLTAEKIIFHQPIIPQNTPKQKTEIVETIKAETIQKPDCKKTLRFNSQNSCFDQETGFINITSNFDKFELINIQTNEQLSELDYLASGQYSLKTHSGQCIDEAQITISAIPCTEIDAFNPKNGDQWEFPLYNQDGSIQIYAPDGQLVYKNNFETGNRNYWEGTNDQGEVLNKGDYFIRIKYTNGYIFEKLISIINL